MGNTARPTFILVGSQAKAKQATPSDANTGTTTNNNQ